MYCAADQWHFSFVFLGLISCQCDIATASGSTDIHRGVLNAAEPATSNRNAALLTRRVATSQPSAPQAAATIEVVTHRDVDVGAIILEPRCHIALPLTVWNMRKRLPSLPIQIFYAKANADCVQEWFGHMENMTFTELASKFWRNSHNNTDMSWIYTNPQFWKKVEHETVLSFQQDSWICGGNAEAKLKSFLQYDYVGAPWRENQVPKCPGGVGNGGFSLRNVKVMEAISARFGQTTENEDTYFCGHLNGWDAASAVEALRGIGEGDAMLPEKIRMPDRVTAGGFSAEEFDGSLDHSPLGTHKLPRHASKDFQRKCPGLHLLASANQMDGSYENDHVKAVKQGKQLLSQAAKLDAGPDVYSLLQTQENVHDNDMLFAVTIKRDEDIHHRIARDQASAQMMGNDEHDNIARESSEKKPQNDRYEFLSRGLRFDREDKQKRLKQTGRFRREPTMPKMSLFRHESKMLKKVIRPSLEEMSPAAEPNEGEEASLDTDSYLDIM